MHEYFWESLPDMSEPALTERLDLGSSSFLVQVSPVRQFDDYGLGVDVVHAWALREDGIPVTLRDVYPSIPREEAYELWSFLCEQLDAAARLAYGLRPSSTGQPNPKLGCWGTRPDLQDDEPDDSTTALVVGVAVDTREAARTGREELFLLAVRSAIVASLRRWIESRPRRVPHPRAN